MSSPGNKTHNKQIIASERKSVDILKASPEVKIDKSKKMATNITHKSQTKQKQKEITFNAKFENKKTKQEEQSSDESEIEMFK